MEQMNGVMIGGRNIKVSHLLDNSATSSLYSIVAQFSSCSNTIYTVNTLLNCTLHSQVLAKSETTAYYDCIRNS